MNESQSVESLRLLVMSDIHSEFARFTPERLPDADLCVIAGDITNFGNRGGWRAKEEMVRARNWMADLRRRFPVFWIPGNHDINVGHGDFQFTEGLPGHHDVKCLLERVEVYRGFSFFGVSCSPCYDMPELANTWDYMTADREEEEGAYESIPNVDVLVSHCPPKGCEPSLDYAGVAITASGNTPVYLGSEPLREAIERTQPALVVCGHIHERSKTGAGIGVTVCLNVARTYALVELEGVPPRRQGTTSVHVVL